MNLCYSKTMFYPKYPDNQPDPPVKIFVANPANAAIATMTDSRLETIRIRCSKRHADNFKNLLNKFIVHFENDEKWDKDIKSLENFMKDFGLEDLEY